MAEQVTIVWRINAGGFKIRQHFITPGSKLDCIGLKGGGLETKEKRHAAAELLIQVWKNSRHYPVGTRWEIEHRRETMRSTPAWHWDEENRMVKERVFQ